MLLACYSRYRSAVTESYKPRPWWNTSSAEQNTCAFYIRSSHSLYLVTSPAIILGELEPGNDFLSEDPEQHSFIRGWESWWMSQLITIGAADPRLCGRGTLGRHRRPPFMFLAFFLLLGAPYFFIIFSLWSTPYGWPLKVYGYSQTESLLENRWRQWYLEFMSSKI